MVAMISRANGAGKSYMMMSQSYGFLDSVVILILFNLRPVENNNGFLVLQMFKLEDVAMGIWIADLKKNGLEVRIFKKLDIGFFDLMFVVDIAIVVEDSTTWICSGCGGVGNSSSSSFEILIVGIRPLMSNYLQVEETCGLDICGDVQLSLFSNKEGKIETSSTRNCVVNVAVVTAVYAFGISISSSCTADQKEKKEKGVRAAGVGKTLRGKEFDGLRIEFSSSFEGVIDERRVVWQTKGLGDKWKWTLNGDGNFLVKDLSRIVEEKILDVETNSQQMIWNKLLPKKVKIFVWRVLKGRIPVREELDKRGIDLDSVLFPCCNSVVESCAHSLVLYDLARGVWEKIYLVEGREIIFS
ncbi:RNA-directed DNA polymerase, eukaryota, reverse transcriptase zinc-binding domain protein [Tanacetum coccineum]|uniref:RNA-directed DNA polymerase, eukaryota, reverse transcriptase zinc-binding domain protein n=1 Tax=Tanacetum coccineum TaxID=301880 RepID=A0ABQ5E377_9ASTR